MVCTCKKSILKCSIFIIFRPVSPVDFDPLPSNVSLPDPQDFTNMLKEQLPTACMLDSFCIRPSTPVFPTLTVQTPMDKIYSYFKHHDCTDCNDICFDEFLDTLAYSDEEREHIEEATRGQYLNQNWTDIKKGILSSSRFKEICHTKDDVVKSCRLLDTQPTTLKSKPVQYGVKNEEKARRLFLKQHRYKGHERAKVSVPGFIISEDKPFLGCSPDGIITCRKCDKFLIEIKCLWKHRNLCPKEAAVKTGICTVSECGDLELKQNHAYYYQIQGQMAISNIHKCYIVFFTSKGIYSVNVPFHNDMWKRTENKLCSFYRNAMFTQFQNAYT